MNQEVQILTHHNGFPGNRSSPHIKPIEAFYKNTIRNKMLTQPSSCQNGPSTITSICSTQITNLDTQSGVKENGLVDDTNYLNVLIMHDHGYSAKSPTSASSPTSSSSNEDSTQFHFDDHSYCHAPTHLTKKPLEADFTGDNRRTEVVTSSANSAELQENQASDSLNGCNFILPDVARHSCLTSCTLCRAETATLKTQLRLKTVALNDCFRQVQSLKDELVLAKELVSQLREQLEENVQTMCTYLGTDHQNQL